MTTLQLQTRITSMCGCYTDRHDRIQHKCAGHAGNPIAAGYTRGPA